MKVPPFFSKEQMDVNRTKGIELFCKERLNEPLEAYINAFDLYRSNFEKLLERTNNLTDFQNTALQIVTDSSLLDAFRYSAAPPISEDDLMVLADVQSLTKSRLAADPKSVQNLIRIIQLVLDRRRFTWIDEKRLPSKSERNTAIIASAALMAASRVSTARRNSSKDQQEKRVRDHLIGLGFTQVPRRSIENLSLAPSLGEFCLESKLGARKADLVVRLWDGRLLPIECKVSNSALNSVKRLNNDAAVKAEIWKRDFGLRQVVPTALLSGVYGLKHLLDAQERGLTIFWAHDLDALSQWIAATKP